MTLTLIIVILTSIISYNCFEDRSKMAALLHSPHHETTSGEYHRLLTSGFVHGGWAHLLINMYVLYGFGEYVEYRFLGMFGEVKGRIFFLLVYLLTIVLANIPTLLKHRNNPAFRSVGASGAVSGILFIFVLLEPWSPGMRLFFVIPIYPIIFGVLYLAYSSWASKNSNDMIDHDAHFAGAVAGMGLAIILKPALLTHFLNAVVAGVPF